MEIKSRGLDNKATSGRKPTPSRDPRTNPRNRSVNRSSRADAFLAFADEVRRDLNPRGPIEAVAADHVASAAWKLKAVVERHVTPTRANPDRPTDAPKAARPTAAERAARTVREALQLLELARGVRDEGPSPAPEIAPNEWPIVPFDCFEVVEIEEEEEAVEEAEAPIWRDRLVFDFEVSDVSPVIRGTWITVGHVVSLIVDGDTWADILRSHPELTEDDLRCCVAYAVAQDQDEA